MREAIEDDELRVAKTKLQTTDDAEAKAYLKWYIRQLEREKEMKGR